MKKNQVVSVSVPIDILDSVDQYCKKNYIPRTSFFVKAAKELLDKCEDIEHKIEIREMK